MRDIKLAQKQLPVLEQELAQLEKENQEIQDKADWYYRHTLSKRKSAKVFLIIGLILGVIFMIAQSFGMGVFVAILAIVLFVVSLKKADSYVDEYRFCHKRITGFPSKIEEKQKEIIKYKAMIDNPFDDIDLYTYEMTPESISALEDEVMLLLKHKIDNIQFTIDKRCWLLANMPLDFMNPNPQESKRHDACLQKLEESGSWILQVTKRFCDAYAASYTLSIVDQALHNINTEDNETVRVAGKEYRTREAPYLDRYMKDFRVAETKKEDEFINLLYTALQSVDPDNDTEVWVFPYGIEKFSLPQTPEEAEETRRFIEHKVFECFVNFADNPSAFVKKMFDDPKFWKGYLMYDLDMHQEMWVDQAVKDLSSGTGTLNFTLHLYIMFGEFVKEHAERYSTVESGILQLLQDAVNNCTKALRQTRQVAEEQFSIHGWTQAQRNQYLASSDFYTIKLSAIEPFTSFLDDNNVVYEFDGDTFFIDFSQTVTMYFSMLSDNNTEDCLKIDKLFANYTIDPAEGALLMRVRHILATHFKTVDRSLDHLIKGF